MTASPDYLNARARGLKGRLLSQARLRELARLEGVPAFVGALLAGTPCAPSLQAAGGVAAGVAQCERAIVDHLSVTLRRLRESADEPFSSWLALAVAPWDVANVKRILRGWRARASPDELAREWMPLGSLSAEELRSLAGTGSASRLADRLDGKNGLGEALARALREAPSPGRDLEDHLDLAWAHYASARAESPTDAAEIFRAFLRWQIDVANVRTALRAAREGGTEPGVFLPGGRRLARERWGLVAGRASLQEAYAALEGTPFYDAARGEAPPFEASASLGRAGERLQAIVLKRMSHVYRRSDPLGLAACLWYGELAANEARNLRKILYGLQHRLPGGLIEEGLVLV